MGNSKNIHDLLASLDFFAFASLWEGMPNAVLEATAMELPEVATNVAGTVEAVEDGVTGFLMPPSDPQAMAERLKYFIDRPEIRMQMGQAGRHCEQEFNVEKMVSQTLALFEELLSQIGVLHN